jgi:hypothetical protein
MEGAEYDEEEKEAGAQYLSVPVSRFSQRRV